MKIKLSKNTNVIEQLSVIPQSNIGVFKSPVCKIGGVEDPECPI